MILRWLNGYQEVTRRSKMGYINSYEHSIVKSIEAPTFPAIELKDLDTSERDVQSLSGSSTRKLRNKVRQLFQVLTGTLLSCWLWEFEIIHQSSMDNWPSGRRFRWNNVQTFCEWTTYKACIWLWSPLFGTTVSQAKRGKWCYLLEETNLKAALDYEKLPLTYVWDRSMD